MKKLFKFSELSDVHCIDCGKRLKKNVLEKNPRANRCYKHHVQYKNQQGRKEYYEIKKIKSYYFIIGGRKK